MSPRRVALPLAALALLTHAPTADANSRFPNALNLVVGPGDRDDLLALETTFGVVVSTDHGATWHYACESALGFSGTFNSPLAIAANGTLVVGLPNALSTASTPYCDFTVPAQAPSAPVADLTWDARGTLLAAAIAPLGQGNGVSLSDDMGVSWRAGWSLGGFFVQTVDIAAGHPSVLYASGLQTSGLPVLYRSTDGGQTFLQVATTFAGGYDAYIAWVDPSNPDTVFVRSDLSPRGTMLLRSDDGGQTFRELVRTQDGMLGVAFAPDGQRIWVGSPNSAEGLLRSTDAGAHWQRIACGFSTLCLRYAAGALYLCGDQLADGFALARSTDDGATFTPLLNFRNLQGPSACAAGTGIHDQCGSSWSMLQSTLASDAAVPTTIDATCEDTDGGADADAGVDAAVDGAALDANATGGDASAADAVNERGGVGMHARGGCGCRTTGGATGRGVAGVVLAWVAALAAAARRRR